jgi:cell division cycle 20-like protein 1 (cofactor of APC complex)
MSSFDRFIPNRSGVDLQSSYNLLNDDNSPTTPSKSQRASQGELNFQSSRFPILSFSMRSPEKLDANTIVTVDEANRNYANVLQNELFGDTVPHSAGPGTPAKKNLFTYSTRSGHPTPFQTPRSQRGPNLNPYSDVYSLSPIKFSSQKMLLTPRKAPRAVSKVPYKVLDAPDLADDFYLNLVDWGSQNILGVGLGSCVYMWNSTSGRVTKLCELNDDTVTSVNWIQRVRLLFLSNLTLLTISAGLSHCYWHQ